MKINTSMGGTYRPSLRELVGNFLRTFQPKPAQPQGLLADGGRALVIDGSAYIVLDWETVMPNVDGVCWRASAGTDYRDPTFPNACQQAHDHGRPFIPFHYYHGSYYTQFPLDDLSRWPSPEKDLQLQNFLGALKYKTYQAVAIDIEEAMNRDITPIWMSKGAKVFCGRVADWMRANKPGVKVFVYSRNTYIAEYAPNINDWIWNYESWIAQWTWNPGAQNMTWEQVRSTRPAETMKPKYFSTRPTWEMWQYSGDRFILPGVYNTQGQPRTLDLNVWNGTRAQFWAYLGFVPNTTPTPPQDPPKDPIPADVKERLEALEAGQAANVERLKVLEEFRAGVKAA